MAGPGGRPILAQQPLTVPTLLVDSLWDQEDIYGAPAVFNAVKASPNAHLVLGPWHHGQANGTAVDPRPARMGRATPAAGSAQNVMIPFLNQHLKDGPPADIARVTAFEAGTNQWQRLADWPQACARGCPANLTPLYLAPGDTPQLLRARRPRRSTSYVSDPAKPVTYRARPNLSPWAQRLDLAHLARATTSASPRLAPTSSPTPASRSPQPLRLAGTPLVHLVASTSGTDSDWVVKLIDVYPDQYPQKPEMGGYQLADRDGRDPRPLPHRPRAPLAASPPNQPLTYEFALPSVDYVGPARPPADGPGPVELVPALRPQPADLRPQHLLRASASDYRAATQRVFTGPDGTWIGLPVVK